MPAPRKDSLSRTKVAKADVPALKKQGRQPLHEAMQRQEERAVVDPKSVKKATRDLGLAQQYQALTKATPAVIQKLIAHAMDEESKYHEMAMKLVVERVAPLAFWKGLAEAENPNGGGSKPSISVTINTTGAPAIEAGPIAHRPVVDLVDVIDVQTLDGAGDEDQDEEGSA
jgi:hypothetical protein